MTSSMSNRLNQPKIADDLIPPHCIHEIKTKGYDVIGVNVPPARSCKLMRFPLKNGDAGPYTTTMLAFIIIINNEFINLPFQNLEFRRDFDIVKN